MKYYVTENRNLKVWTEKPYRDDFCYDHFAYKGNFMRDLEAWQTSFDKQDEILTSPELKEQLTPGQVIEGGSFGFHCKLCCGNPGCNDWKRNAVCDEAIAVPLDTATEQSNLREALQKCISRFESIGGSADNNEDNEVIEAARKALATPTDKFTRQDMEGLLEWVRLSTFNNYDGAWRDEYTNELTTSQLIDEYIKQKV
jgi:hypothetical protein